MRILIVEDHGTVRIGIKYMLRDILPSAHIAMTENLDSALHLLSAESFDLIILDLNIPGGGAPTMIRKIRTIREEVRILIFSGHDELVYALPCLQAGADGYLSKDAPDEAFTVAIKSIMNGQKYLSPQMQQQAIQKIAGSGYNKGPIEKTPAHILSAREMEVMHLLLKGLGTAEIAAQIHLQLSTVSTYKMKIFEKLGVKNIVELIEKVKLHME